MADDKVLTGEFIPASSPISMDARLFFSDDDVERLKALLVENGNTSAIEGECTSIDDDTPQLGLDKD